MNLVRSVFPGAYAAKARGALLCAITLSTAYVYYLAVDADDAIPPAAAAESIAAPPVIRAAALTQPIHVIRDPSMLDTAAKPSPDRATIVRQLQTALALSHCYDGPISGKWTSASQQAMDAFLMTVNAQLPVSEPGPDLLALVQSNGAKCAPMPALVLADNSAALTPRSVARLEERTQLAIVSDVEPMAPGAGFSIAADQRSMLDHPWAQPEMLVPSHDMTSGAAAAAPIATSSIEPAVESAGGADRAVSQPQATTPVAPVAQPVTKINATAKRGAPLQFEGGRVVSETIPDPAPASSATLPAEADPPRAAAAPAKVSQRKAKAAKRKARPNDDTFGVSFDSIQRSITSLFD